MQEVNEGCFSLLDYLCELLILLFRYGVEKDLIGFLVDWYNIQFVIFDFVRMDIVLFIY